ncbi:hypothetical protein L1049_018254 [Liquidambar formosana]|uniref:hexokinase n=1 Tax=Liquidambar formosana TaxID=63359 RepID=A0AAP0WLV8_LIQFO
MGKVVLGVAVSCAVATCAIAAILVGRRVRSRRKWSRVVGVLKELEEACESSVGRLRQVVDAMAVEMHAGLASEGGSKLKMLLTFVDTLPNGSEKGTYYALDLGGTNFRVLRVQLGGQRSDIPKHDVKRQPIPQNLMTSTSRDLFDFIASSLQKFVESEGTSSELSPVRRRELGFTFSFPVKQTSVSSGILIKWTKAFAIEDMVGRDVADCLQQAMTNRGLDMRVAALVNDTVGTLALGHYHDVDTVAAVIIGTGTNACYLERTDAIIKCQGLLTTSGGMVVNMEWGNFWSSHLPRTSYDIDLDADSPNPNDQGFEKMISGMYLGDIVRRVILRMSQESDIFGPVSSNLSTRFIFKTPDMSKIHEDESPDLREVARIWKDILEIPDVPLKVRKLIVKVCDVVTRRAARLAAAGIVGILKKIGRDGSGGITGGRMRVSDSKMRRTVVAIEGSLYTSYSAFREYLNEAVDEILGEDIARHKAVKKKGWYPLRPGIQGFFITCDGGRERQASREAIDVIDSFYEELVHGSDSGIKLAVFPNKPLNKKTKFSYSDSSSSDDDDDEEEEEKEEEEEEDKSDTCKDDAANHENPASEKSDPHNYTSCNENQTKGETDDNKDSGKNHEIQANEVEEPPAKKQCLETDASKREEKSIDKLIEEELKELGDRNKRRFVNLDSGCNGVVIVQMQKRDGDPRPKDIAQHMMTSAASTRKHMSRFILRLLPVEVTCYASEEEISKAIKPLVTQYFPVETQSPQKFAVLYEARANSGIDRMKIINSVAKSVPGPHKVDLNNPDKTIVVQIVKTVCLIGIVEKYKELAKYNLRQLTSPKP